MSDATDQPTTYHVDLGGHRYPVREVTGTETISKPFRIEAKFRLEEGRDLDPQALVKSDANVVLKRGDVVRTISGVVADVWVSAATTGAPEAFMALEPRMALSRFRSDLRVFRDMTVPQMVVDVLSQIGVTPELRLSGSYPVRPYTVQMRETDFHFVNRLMEEDGIFYFFLEGDVMVMGDNPNAYESLPGDSRIPFRAGTGLDENLDEICQVGARAAMSVGKVSLRDWNHLTPSLNMDVQAAGPSPTGPEYYDYPGEYLEPGRGAQIASLMAEAYARNSEGLVGKTFCGRFGPGFSFTLADSPAGVSDGLYALTKVVHDWHRDKGGFSTAFEALSGDLTYRAPRVHEEPVLPNPLTGFVVGPPGPDDIHTNEMGHVKVHFPWDRRMPKDDNASDWVPVLQNNTGHSVNIPRMGWEVLCHFQEGDPDRPIVLGRVFNGADVIHTKLPRDKTRSSIKSYVSPSREGTNEIQFEDVADREHIWVHAEKDQNIVVANDFTEDVKVDESVKVDNDETFEIGNDHTCDVTMDYLQNVDHDQTWSVSGNRKRKIHNADVAHVEGDRTMTVNANHELEIGLHCTVSAVLNMEETISGAVTETSDKNNATECNKSMTLDVTGSVTETAKEEKSMTAGEERKETVTGNFAITADGEIKTRANKPLKTDMKAALTVTCKKPCGLTGTKKFDAFSATGQHTAAKSITFKVKDTFVQLKDGLVMIKAKSAIKVTIAGTNALHAAESNQN